MSSYPNFFCIVNLLKIFHVGINCPCNLSSNGWYHCFGVFPSLQRVKNCFELGKNNDKSVTLINFSLVTSLSHIFSGRVLHYLPTAFIALPELLSGHMSLQKNDKSIRTIVMDNLVTKLLFYHFSCWEVFSCFLGSTGINLSPYLFIK